MAAITPLRFSYLIWMMMSALMIQCVSIRSDARIRVESNGRSEKAPALIGGVKNVQMGSRAK
jgi:hypothetical protein